MEGEEFLQESKFEVRLPQVSRQEKSSGQEQDLECEKNTFPWAASRLKIQSDETIPALLQAGQLIYWPSHSAATCPVLQIISSTLVFSISA